MHATLAACRAPASSPRTACSKKDTGVDMDMDMDMDKRQVAVDAAVRHEGEFSVMVCSVYARPRAARRPRRRLILRALALALLATMLPGSRLITTVQPAPAATDT